MKVAENGKQRCLLIIESLETRLNILDYIQYRQWRANEEDLKQENENKNPSSTEFQESSSGGSMQDGLERDSPT